MIGSSNRKESKSPLGILLILSIVTGSICLQQNYCFGAFLDWAWVNWVLGRWAVYLLHATGRQSPEWASPTNLVQHQGGQGVGRANLPCTVFMDLGINLLALCPVLQLKAVHWAPFLTLFCSITMLVFWVLPWITCQNKQRNRRIANQNALLQARGGYP